MTSRICLLTLGWVFLVNDPLLAQGRRDQSFRYGWIGSLEEGKAQARRTGKPIMFVLRCQP